MSGIVGIVHADGNPVDGTLLARLTHSLCGRGPDGERSWVLGSVGFGHTLLSTSCASTREQQPQRLGTTWIVADARLDGREDLVAALGEEGDTDPELILHAYRAWGEECVTHLIGDFAFAIWDGSAGRLFCARDHFGVKPFYYAHKNGVFLFGNSLNTIRLHPIVSDDLNELAVADFLMFEMNQEWATTTFRDVRRLPPGHALTVSAAGVASLRRYWTLPAQTRVMYPRRQEYVERFTELFDRAVRDRTRTDRVAVLMSGGLDSSSIAATASKLPGDRSSPLSVRAHTMVYDRLMPDRERHYSGVAADYMRIPIHYLPVDDYRLFQGWDRADLPRPEPTTGVLDQMERDFLEAVASHDRVALSGDGGDAVQCPPHGHLATLLKDGRLGTILGSAVHLWQTTGRLPRIGVRFTIRQLFGGGAPYMLPYPPWLNPDLERQFSLRDRWRDVQEQAPEESIGHPRREAYNFLAQPYWPNSFEMQDPGATRKALEIRYPFMDVRLVEFMLGIPPIPWCVEKNVLRVAMLGRLPDEVRLRPKTPLVSDDIVKRHEQAAAGRAEWTASGDLGRFVDVKKLVVGGKRPAEPLWQSLMPLALDWWLRHFRALPA